MRLFVLFILSIPIYLNAQIRYEHNYEYDYAFQRDEAGRIIFEDILSEPCKSKEELFKKGTDWVSSLSGGVLGFKVVTEDFDSGLILVRGRTDNFIYTKSHYSATTDQIESNYNRLSNRNSGSARNYKNAGQFTYKIEINFKEGKTRITIYDIDYHAGEVKGMKDGALLNEHYPASWRKLGKNLLKREWYQYKRIAIQEFNALLHDYSQELAVDYVQDW